MTAPLLTSARDTPASVGAELLDDIMTFIGRFVIYPSEHAQRAHALWIVHTHLMDAWESTPRIAFLSPEPGSGKTRALEVTEPLVPRPVASINATPAYLFRKVSDEAGLPTILYDEIDTVFGPKAKDNEEVRGLLNAGHRKGASAGRCVIHGKQILTEDFPAYCAVALAGLDDLPDTLMSRSVVIRMNRRTRTEHVEPWRPRVNHPEAHALRARIEAWAGEIRSAVTGAWPEMPLHVADRDADIWEALLAVADATGDPTWANEARRSAVALVAAVRDNRQGLGVTLLRDIRTVFAVADEMDPFGNSVSSRRMKSKDLVRGLIALEESPWGDMRGKPIDQRGLAFRLGKYGIKSKDVRMGTTVAKGYDPADFLDAWDRYVSPTRLLSQESATSATPQQSTNGTLLCPCGNVAELDHDTCWSCT